MKSVDTDKAKRHTNYDKFVGQWIEERSPTTDRLAATGHGAVEIVSYGESESENKGDP